MTGGSFGGGGGGKNMGYSTMLYAVDLGELKSAFGSNDKTQ
jgi:hypothetical protein